MSKKAQYPMWQKRVESSANIELTFVGIGLIGILFAVHPIHIYLFVRKTGIALYQCVPGIS